jgi:hypothetical protein
VKHLQVFGCEAYAHKPIETRMKLEPKSTKCVFVGYNLESKGYKSIVLENRKLIISQNVIFNEKFNDGRHESFAKKPQKESKTKDHAPSSTMGAD